MKLNYLEYYRFLFFFFQRQTEPLDRHCWNNFRAVPFPGNLFRFTFLFSKEVLILLFFSHLGMATLPDASADVGDGKAARSSGAVPRSATPCQQLGGVERAGPSPSSTPPSLASPGWRDAGATASLSRPSRSITSTPAPQLGHRWAPAARAPPR